MLARYVYSALSRYELAQQLHRLSVANENVCSSRCPCAANYGEGLFPSFQTRPGALADSVMPPSSSGAARDDDETQETTDQASGPSTSPLQMTLNALANAGIVSSSPAPYAAMAILIARHSDSSVARHTLLAGFEDASHDASMTFMTCCLWRFVDRVRVRLPAADMRHVLERVPISVYKRLARSMGLNNEPDPDLFSERVYPLGTYPLPESAKLDQGTAYTTMTRGCTPYAAHSMLSVMREVSAIGVGRHLCGELLQALPGRWNTNKTEYVAIGLRAASIIATTLAHHLPFFLDAATPEEEAEEAEEAEVAEEAEEAEKAAVSDGEGAVSTPSRAELGELAVKALVEACGQLMKPNASKFVGPYIIGLLMERLPAHLFALAKEVGGVGAVGHRDNEGV